MSIVVIGSGGHARVVLEIITLAEQGPIAGLLDDRPQRVGAWVDDVQILGPMRLLPELLSSGRVQRAAVAVGDNAVRQRLIQEVLECQTAMPVLIHPSAIISPRASVGTATQVCAAAILGPGANTGVGCIINTRATVDHDCLLEDYVHIGPGAILAGAVHIGSRTLVGAGATIIPGIKIGADCIVGAGATVIRDVPDGKTVVGCPAQPIRSR